MVAPRLALETIGVATEPGAFRLEVAEDGVGRKPSCGEVRPPNSEEAIFGEL